MRIGQIRRKMGTSRTEYLHLFHLLPFSASLYKLIFGLS